MNSIFKLGQVALLFQLFSLLLQVGIGDFNFFIFNILFGILFMICFLNRKEKRK